MNNPDNDDEWIEAAPAGAYQLVQNLGGALREVEHEARPLKRALAERFDLPGVPRELSDLIRPGVGWWLQGFGIYELDLMELGATQPRVRVVHVFDPEMAWAEQFPHSHPWSFESRVLKGAVRSAGYEEEEPDSGPTHDRIRMLGNAVTSVTPVRLAYTGETFVPEGRRYRVRMTETHIARAAAGTVTVVDRPRLGSRSMRAYMPGYDARTLGMFHGGRWCGDRDLARLRELVG